MAKQYAYRAGRSFPDLEKACDQAKDDMVREIANKAKNHFLEGFENAGGQTDKSKQGWASRKRETKKSKGRAILVDSGDLRGDIDVRRTTFDEIVIGTQNVRYAEYHNEGTKYLPQRQFLGGSQSLNGKIRRIIARILKKYLK